MSSSSRFTNANTLASTGAVLNELLGPSDLAELLRETRVDWKTGHLLSAPSEVVRVLDDVSALGDDRRLTPIGISLLSKLQIDLEAAVRDSSLTERFDLLSPIG